MARDALRRPGGLCRRVLIQHLDVASVAGPVKCLLVNELDYGRAAFMLDRRNLGKQFGRFPRPRMAISASSYTRGSSVLFE